MLPRFVSERSSQEIWAMSDEQQRAATKDRIKKIFEKDKTLLNEILSEMRKEKINKIKNEIEKR